MLRFLSFVSSIGKEAEAEEHGNSLKLQVLHMFYKLFLIFSDIVSFQHVLHFDVGRSQTELILKVK